MPATVFTAFKTTRGRAAMAFTTRATQRGAFMAATFNTFTRRRGVMPAFRPAEFYFRLYAHFRNRHTETFSTGRRCAARTGSADPFPSYGCTAC